MKILTNYFTQTIASFVPTYRGNALVSLQNFSRRLLELFNGALKVNTVKKSRDMNGTFITGLAIRKRWSGHF
ncbi:MAG: hypothetical protein ACK54J_09535 [Pseudanabaena sp.]|jgi:hypothetical protein|nr:hypothetical protein [Pseudanabaena sp. M037S2SP2A07QC]MCA6555087.1 hypothetical protein [Pseudanabaena sp. M114S2SP2A07QC]MCA6579353.1 hypothetical protein [Pseudanabaena sp. M085S1SP2A07QC]